MGREGFLPDDSSRDQTSLHTVLRVPGPEALDPGEVKAAFETLHSQVAV